VKKTILVVEDHRVRSDNIENALRGIGYGTRWTDASDIAWQCLNLGASAVLVQGREMGWEAIEGGSYALMILDVDAIRVDPYGQVLRGEGMRLLRRLRGDPRFSAENLPVIGVTHHMPPNAATWREEFLASGGNEFFEYWLNMEEVLRAVERLTGGAVRRY